MKTKSKITTAFISVRAKFIFICILAVAAFSTMFFKDAVMTLAFNGTDSVQTSENDYKYTAAGRDIDILDIVQNNTMVCSLDAYGEVDNFAYGVDENATVGDLLSYADVSVSADDEINYSLGTQLTDGIDVVVRSVTYEVVTVDEAIPHTSKVIPVIYAAENKKFQDIPGEDGMMLVQKAVKYIDGQIADEQIISYTTVNEPKDGVMYVDESRLLANSSGKPQVYVDELNVRLTAYTYNDVGSSITASGEAARVGYVAVDRSVIPMNSYLYIVTDDGFVYGYCYAKDTGGAVKGNTIDIFLPSKEDCIQFGVRNAKCYVVRYGD